MTMMTRVCRTNKCPICHKDTWCLIGKSIILCMRVTSSKSKSLKGGEVAYVHDHPNPEHGLSRPWQPKKREPKINARKVMAQWQQSYESDLEFLSEELGVSIDSLERLECWRAGGQGTPAWAFPMFDGYHNYIGIRIRNLNGNKWAVTGSQAGIFIPNLPPEKRMFVAEGPTDTAAGLTLGLYTVGRPSCSGGVIHIVDLVKYNRIKEVVIVADGDDPGIRGAQDLQKWLPVPSCVLLLPCKDLREFIRFGDKSTIDSMIEQLVWTQPKGTE
jgi:hypothetical protein